MRKALLISGDVCRHIMETIAARKPETGGILGGRGRFVSRFCFDALAAADDNTYSPNVDFLNEALWAWQAEGLDFLGFIHSHDQKPRHLSTNDLSYARSILDANRGAISRVFFVLLMHPFQSVEESLLSFLVTPGACHRLDTVIR